MMVTFKRDVCYIEFGNISFLFYVGNNESRKRMTVIDYSLRRIGRKLSKELSQICNQISDRGRGMAPGRTLNASNEISARTVIAPGRRVSAITADLLAASPQERCLPHSGPPCSSGRMCRSAVVASTQAAHLPRSSALVDRRRALQCSLQKPASRTPRRKKRVSFPVGNRIAYLSGSQLRTAYLCSVY